MSETVIIVLGYQNDVCGKLHPITVQRADKACQVARERIALNQNVKLICTGDFGDKFNRSDTAHGVLIKVHMVRKGVADNLFLSHAPSHNTYEDGKFCADILRHRSVCEIILVTSDFHMKRGFLWCNHFNPGKNIVCQPAITEFDEGATHQTDMSALIQHEQQAIKYFYRDCPHTPPLDALYDWERLALPV